MNPRNITDKLKENGFEAFLVGGFVRDRLLGKENADYDIATNATPHQIETLFQGHKINYVGSSFQVSVVEDIEVATYRTDRNVGIGKDNCVTSICTTLEEDLGRRDFTINAMAFDPDTKKIIDPFNGTKDLDQKIIKFVGNPEDRIYEDPCRILRACRFLALIEGEFDELTYHTLYEYNHYVKLYVFPERIRLEVLKAMKYPKASLFFKALENIGILESIFPSLHKCIGCESGGYHAEKDVFEHCMLVGDSVASKNQLLKLTGYLHDVGKPSAKKLNDFGSLCFHQHEDIGSKLLYDELKELIFTNEEIKYITDLTKHHMKKFLELSPKTTRKFIRVFKEDGVDFKDWIRLCIADKVGNKKSKNYTLSEIKTTLQSFEEQLNPEENNVFDIKSLALNGNDVMNLLNIEPGPQVGIALSKLFELVLVDPTLNTKENLAKLLSTI